MRFKRLIAKHSNTYKLLHQKEGNWDGPKWEEGEKEAYEIKAAIFPIAPEDVRRYEGLGYTTRDIHVYIAAKADGSIKAHNLQENQEENIQLKESDEIEYQDQIYVLDSKRDNTTHADFMTWIAVRKQVGGSDD